MAEKILSFRSRRRYSAALRFGAKERQPRGVWGSDRESMWTLRVFRLLPSSNYAPANSFRTIRAPSVNACNLARARPREEAEKPQSQVRKSLSVLT